MYSILTVWRKELIDAIRDRRALKLAFLPPIYFVGMFTLGMFFTINLQQDTKEELTTLPVVGADYVPELISWFKEHQIIIEEAPADAYGAVQAQTLEYALIIPKEAGAQQQEGKSIDVWLVYDASKQSVHPTLGKLRQLFYEWNSTQASMNILARGLSPQLASPVAWHESNVANEQKMGGLILAGVPLLLMMCAVMGSLGFAADMTAGERERRSLESLLINPITSMRLIWGKWLAAVLLSVAVVFLCLFLMSIALHFIPFNELGLRVDVTLWAYVKIFFSLIPVTFIAAGLQLSLGILSRSFKDAQTYMGFLVLLPMVPFFIMTMNPDWYAPWHLWVPLLGQQAVLKDLLLGELIPSIAILAFWVSSIPITLAALWLAARQLRKAKTIYG